MKKRGYSIGKKKLKLLLKDINNLAINSFDKLYNKDVEFQNECEEGLDSYSHIKDFILALAEEIKLQYGPVGCSVGCKRLSMKRVRRYYKQL